MWENVVMHILIFNFVVEINYNYGLRPEKFSSVYLLSYLLQLIYI